MSEPRDAALNVRVPSRVKAKLQYLAKRDGISVADIVVEFLPAVIAAYEMRRHDGGTSDIGARPRHADSGVGSTNA